MALANNTKSFRVAGLLALCLLLLITGCRSAYQSPVADIDEPRFLDTDRIHRVNQGETLYAIAWIYDLDFLHIARVNNLSSPYTIFPGQILNVDPRAVPAQTASTTAVAVASPAIISRPTTTSRAASPSPSRPQSAPVPQPARPPQPQTSGQQPDTRTPSTAPSPSAPLQQGPVSWGWPASGAIVGRFNAAGVENKGIDIAGSKGDAVVAAADGEVVYAGSGLLRYGDLIIIKHNDRYLSAYAHNSALLVDEGDRVRRGEKIAELGSTGVDREMLHFEIREEGKPIDPLKYLPPRS